MASATIKGSVIRHRSHIIADYLRETYRFATARTTAATQSGNVSKAATLWHAGVGYAFPGGAALSVDFGPRAGDWGALDVSSVSEKEDDARSLLLHNLVLVKTFWGTRMSRRYG